MRNTKAEVLVMFSLLLMLIYLSYLFVSNVFVNGRCEANALKDSRKSRKISQDIRFYSTYPNREPHRNVQFHSRFSVLLKFLVCGLPSQCETDAFKTAFILTEGRTWEHRPTAHLDCNLPANHHHSHKYTEPQEHIQYYCFCVLYPSFAILKR
jgi:hypothetical protein